MALTAWATNLNSITQENSRDIASIIAELKSNDQYFQRLVVAEAEVRLMKQEFSGRLARIEDKLDFFINNVAISAPKGTPK